MPIRKRINYIILFALIPVLYIPCYMSYDILIKMTKEDGLYESMGALFFLLASMIFIVLAAKPFLFKRTEGNSKPFERWYFVFFAFLFFVAFGEEISWGQRILNFETPDSIKEANVQEEFNFHNLEVFNGRMLDGEEKGGIASYFELHKLFYMAFFVFLFLVPILHKYSAFVRNIIEKIHLPVPSLVLGVLFVLNLVYGHLVKVAIQNEIPEVAHGVVEIKEVMIAFILFLLPIFWINYTSKKEAGIEPT